jgi:hypothetical protein
MKEPSLTKAGLFGTKNKKAPYYPHIISEEIQMTRVKTSLMIPILLFSLIGCAQGPIAPSAATTTFTPDVDGTLTAIAAGLASPTPWIAGTETALADLTPTPWIPGTETALANLTPTPWIPGTETALAVASSTPTPLPLPTFDFSATATFPPPALEEGTFSPVFYGSNSFLLLGGFSRDQGWISAENAFAYVNNEVEYDFFNPRGSFKLRGSTLELSPTCRYHFMRSSASLPESMVGVASGWVTEQREIRELASNDPAYIQAVTEWFQSRGTPPGEIRITRILQADLEGDGVNEVLVSATYFKDTSGHMTETGDYSVILMRKVSGNQVLTIPLISEYYVSSAPELSYPKTYTLAEAIDLNQDGILEVVVDVSRWEGGGAIVFRVDGQNVREVLRAIC